MACKAGIHYFIPKNDGVKVLDMAQVQVRYDTTVNFKSGDTAIIVNSNNYDGIHNVLKTTPAPDGIGGNVFIKADFIDIGDANPAGIPIDKTGGTISKCPEDLEGAPPPTKPDTTKYILYGIGGLVALLAIIAIFKKRKPKI